jgi:hypothetical protein
MIDDYRHLECAAPEECGGCDFCCNCSTTGTFHGDCGLTPEQIAQALKERAEWLQDPAVHYPNVLSAPLREWNDNANAPGFWFHGHLKRMYGKTDRVSDIACRQSPLLQCPVEWIDPIRLVEMYPQGKP